MLGAYYVQRMWMSNFHEVSQNLLSRRVEVFRAAVWAKLEMDESRSNSHLEDRSRWRRRWPAMTTRSNGDCRGMQTRLSPCLLAKITDWRRLAGTKLRKILMDLMKEGPPDEGASRGSRHRADSEKSAKQPMLGRRWDASWKGCIIDRSTRWGLRPLKARFSSLAITCTFNGKCRWHEMQTSIPCYFHQSKFLLFMMNSLINLELIFL